MLPVDDLLVLVCSRKKQYALNCRYTVSLERQLEPNDLQLFATVARLGSFSKAARERGISRATVSRVIQRMEAEHGTSLLHRTTRRVALTPAGADLLARVSGPLDALNLAIARLRRRSDEPSGTLRISATSDIASSLLVPVVKRLVLRYPALRVETILTLRPVDLLGEQVDAALRTYAAGPSEPDLIARRLGRITFGWFGAPSYLAQYGTPTTLGALEQHRTISSAALSGESTVRVDDPLFGLHLAKAGAGLALLSDTLCGSAVANGELTRVLPDVVRLTGHLWLVYPEGGHSPNLDAFRTILLEQLPAYGLGTAS